MARLSEHLGRILQKSASSQGAESLILAEGAIALLVTLSGSALFAS
jgi:hypothetical protein